MAKVEFNSSLAGIRGKLGGLIYREQHGQTVVLAAYRPKKKWTAAQHAARERFREAQAYAARVLADPLWRERYLQLAAERKKPVNALLVANFLNSPTVDRVDLSQFRGQAGDIVRVLATDAIEVVSIGLTIYAASGTALETGPAVKEHDVWIYRCATALAGQARKIEVTAVNRAGARGTGTQTL